MKVSTIIAFVSILLLAAPDLAADIAGVWKVDNQPAWIEIIIDGDTTIGTVARHDSRPQAVGRVMLKDVRQVEDNVWQGQIYAARLDSFRDARIELSGVDKLAWRVVELVAGATSAYRAVRAHTGRISWWRGSASSRVTARRPSAGSTPCATPT